MDLQVLFDILFLPFGRLQVDLQSFLTEEV